MALLFMDSFDHYATADLTTKWTAIALNGSGAALTIDPASGRRSSAGLKATYSNAGIVASNVSKTLVPADANFIIGCAFRTDIAPSATNGSGILAVYDTGTAQLTLMLLSDFRLQVKRGDVSGGTVLATQASATLSANTFAYIEFKGLIHPTAGTIDVRVNGVSVISASSLNTRNTANATWTAVQVGLQYSSNPGVSANECEYDDLYVLDGTGSAPWNAFLGDCRVDARVPTAPGATTGWTPSAGSNWQNVDDAAPNGDTDYNSAASTGVTDTFVVQDSPSVGATIYGIQHCLSVKKSDASICTVAPVVRHSAVDYVGSDISPSTSYAFGLLAQQINPGTSAQWTEASFNAAEFGYKRTA
jgi:hypothetical protein